MCDTRAIQIALVIDEHLGLVGEPSERIAMDDAIPIALKLAAVLWWWLRIPTATSPRGIGGVGC